MPAVVEKYLLGSQATLVTGTALNALANGSLVLGSAFNNVVGGGGGDGYTLCRAVMTFKFQSAPTANTGIAVWFLRNTDGTTGSAFEDGGTALTPSRVPDVVFPVYADTAAHAVARDVLLPPGFLKGLVKNDGTGQAFTANNTDNVLTITPYTSEGV